MGIKRLFKKRRLIWGGVALLLFGFILINAMAAMHAWRLTHMISNSSGKRTVPESMSVLDKAKFVFTGKNSLRSHLGSKPSFPFRDICTTSSDGLKLVGWEKVADSNTTATMILCHGHGASRSSVLPEAEVFRQLGFRVLMFDFRAHGESDGDLCSVGYYEANDVEAAWDYVRSHYPGDEIYLYGISMGAVAISRAIATDDIKPSAVILDMPFDGLIDAIRSRVRLMGLPTEPAASLLTFWGGIEMGFWAFDFATSDYMARIDCPVLLEWGTVDTRVTGSEIDRIVKSAQAGNVRLVKYPDLGHVSLCRNAPELWRRNVVEFLGGVSSSAVR